MRSHFDAQLVTLKATTTRELATLLKLIQSFYRFDKIPFSREPIRSGLRLLVNDKALGRAWFIAHKQKVIGYVVATFGFDLEFGGRQATVTDLYLKAPYRRRGAGRRVLGLVEEFCRGRGIGALELQVARRNLKALRFYEGCGFKAHARIPMSKRLGPMGLKDQVA